MVSCSESAKKSTRLLSVICCSACLFLFSASWAPADVFNSPAGQTSLSLVQVGNPGNPNDNIGSGGVPYNFSIGKFEITIGQYTEFLNAVAATDTYSLYNTFMAQDAFISGIARTGVSGSFSYSAIGSPNHPIAYVSWGDAARFANWLTNGQPTGAQNPSTTEDGSYFLNGAVSDTALMAITRKPNARFVLPTDNEWYKAAYYDPTSAAGGGDNYWLYPMRNNTTPYSDQPPGLDAPIPSTTGNFNKNDGIANGYDDGFAVSGPNYLTDVGAYIFSASFYGTFDQAGNIEEWNETADFSRRTTRGGSWLDGAISQATNRGLSFPTTENPKTGFRIAAVPEPSSLVLLTLAIGGMFARRRPVYPPGFARISSSRGRSSGGI